jgi:hypothetical protein
VEAEALAVFVYLATMTSMGRPDKTVFWEWLDHVVGVGHQIGVVVICLDDRHTVRVLLGEKVLVVGLFLGGCEFAQGTVEGI